MNVRDGRGKLPRHLLIFGLGYTGAAVARAASAAGFRVTAAMRTPAPNPDAAAVPFDSAGEAIGAATHILATAPPGEGGDPVLAEYAGALAAARDLAWLGYYSTTGVYGDRQGGRVDETTAPSPSSPRAARRVAAEAAWARAAEGRPLDIMRLAGIYGPGRSVFDELRAGRARRIVRPGHVFGRIHRDDIACATLAAMERPPSGTRVLNFSDDEPAPSADVVLEAARLLGLAPPPAIAFEDAYPAMSDMARSFWAESRLVDSRGTAAAIGRRWRYPSYREGLRAILAEEAENGRRDQGEIGRA